MTALSLLGRFFTESNCTNLLDEARHRRKPEVEEMVARLNPKPDASSLVRKVAEARRGSPSLPVQSAAGLLDAATSECVPTPSVNGPTVEVAQPARAVIRPLAPERYKVQFTVSGETRAKLRVVQDLLRHSIPSGDVGLVFDRGYRRCSQIYRRRSLRWSFGLQRRRGRRQRVRASFRRLSAARCGRATGAAAPLSGRTAVAASVARSNCIM